MEDGVGCAGSELLGEIVVGSCNCGGKGLCVMMLTGDYLIVADWSCRKKPIVGRMVVHHVRSTLCQNLDR